jgi:ribosomal protein S18 acetylase RimI-like enzyme
MARYEVRDFTLDAVYDAARLLAKRHRAHLRAVVALDPSFAVAEAAREQIAGLLQREPASGAIAYKQGTAVAFMVGTRRPDEMWGPNVWVESAGSAGADIEAIREAYARAAGRWFDEGRRSHYVIVPASDRREIEAWFSLGFGQQHIHGLRHPVRREFEPTLRQGLTVRRAVRADIPALAELDRELPRHQAGSPVFSRVPPLTIEQAQADIEREFDDPNYATFVAEHEGRVVGAAVACSMELSPGNTGLMRPRSAGFLGFAAVMPAARGLGAGRALGETVFAWSRDEGYEWIGVDWRATNLLASRTWLALGFKPTFYRLHRAIV